MVASANDCIMSKCPHELDACINDATCAASLECSVACEDSACTQQCAHKAYVSSSPVLQSLLTPHTRT